MKDLLEAGKVINKRGLAGELKVESYCDFPEVFSSIKYLYIEDDPSSPRKVVSSNVYRGFVYLKLEGICDCDAADRLRGRTLLVKRDEISLCDGAFFLADLIGLSVIDSENGRCYGKITDVSNYGATDVYTVNDNGKEYYFPAADEFIVSIDTEKGVFVKTIPGMFVDGEEI